jgi:octaprenyl-diphosphate synthase
VGANQDCIRKMRKFGEYIGIAFQIKDDLFDYSETKIGKPTGIDIKEQKMTLPLIHTLNTCSKSDKAWLINSVKKHNKDKKRVKEVIAFVKENGGIEYTITKMNDYKNKALAILKDFPESKYKKSLETMIDYVVERKV